MPVSFVTVIWQLTKDRIQRDGSVVDIEDTWALNDDSDNSSDDGSDNFSNDGSDNSSNNGLDNSSNDGSNDPTDDDSDRIDSKTRRNWGFAFTHASRSSKSILVALRWLRISPNVYLQLDFVGTDWIVPEMIEWLKVCVPVLSCFRQL